MKSCVLWLVRVNHAGYPQKEPEEMGEEEGYVLFKQV